MSSKLNLSIVALVLVGCSSASETNEAKVARVQKDVRRMVDAAYEGDVETIIDFTHPRILQMMGGVPSARQALEETFKKTSALGMKLDEMKFPTEPTFLRGSENEFVIVPTLSIVAANSQRAESLNYQFGARKIGSADWKYVEGSRVNKDNVNKFFPDFPKDYEFPQIYRKKIEARP